MKKGNYTIPSVRWCALFNSMDSVNVNKDALKSLALDPENTSMKDHVPSDNEFLKINDYCNLLVPIKDMTTVLGGSKYSTTSLLFPAIHYLCNEELPNNTFITYDLQCLNQELIKSV